MLRYKIKYGEFQDFGCVDTFKQLMNRVEEANGLLGSCTVEIEEVEKENNGVV